MQWSMVIANIVHTVRIGDEVAIHQRAVADSGSGRNIGLTFNAGGGGGLQAANMKGATTSMKPP